MSTTYALPCDYDVVSRRVNQRSSSFRHVLHLLPLGIGQLRIDGPFTPTGDDIELRAWSQRATELRLRPVSRRLPAWSKRRQRRYFEHAHHSADQLVRWLDAAVRRHDVTVALTRRRFADQRPVTGVMQHVR